MLIWCAKGVEEARAMDNTEISRRLQRINHYCLVRFSLRAIRGIRRNKVDLFRIKNISRCRVSGVPKCGQEHAVSVGLASTAQNCKLSFYHVGP